MPAELTEDETYTVKATTTNMSTKAGVPVAAPLTVNIAAVVNSQVILQDSEVYGFAAEETYTFEFSMAVPMGTGGKAGAVVAEVLDPNGNKLADGSLDVVILPVTANLLLNPGFEDAFEHWTAYSNYPGRAHWVPSDEHPYEGLKSAAFAASVGGRPVVCTLSQVVPWDDRYKGQTFQLSAMRGSYPAGTAHDIEGMLTFYIYDGVTYAQNAVYVSHREAYREQSVVMTLSPNANRLEVIFQIVPPRDFHGSAIYLDKAILEQL